MRRTVKVSTAVLVLLAMSSGAAAAQAPPGGSFTGGAVSSARTDAGSAEVGLTVSADGARIALRGAVAVRCAGRTGFFEATFKGTLPVGPDGAFAGKLGRGDQLRATGGGIPVSVAGTAGAAGATGTFTVGPWKPARRTCRAQTVAFQAVPAPALADAPAAAPAGAALLGRTSGVGGGPFGFNLRVSADGKRIMHAIYSLRRRCRTIAEPEETNYSPAITIRADGSFRKVERFTGRFTDATERNTITTTGRFVAGGAIGTLRWTSVARSPKSGKIIDRCDSGTLRWSAVVAG